MKQVSIKPFYGEVFLQDELFKIDNGHNIFFKLNDKLKRNNVDLHTVDTYPHADVYVYCDVPYPWELKLWLDLFLHKNKNILFCFESPLVNPFSHFKLIHRLFSKIYTWDDTRVDSRKYRKFYIPQINSSLTIKKRPFYEKNFLVFINANKSVPPFFQLFTSYKSDLYKERRKAVNFFSNTIPDNFALYGRGWEDYKTHHGLLGAEEKLKVLSNYKFCLCFENARAPGYITEKIFDCFKARCVPVYFGAPNIKNYIPAGCFIDFEKFSSYDELLKFLESMTEERYKKYISNIDAFLNNKDNKRKWFEEGFGKTILMAIN